MLMKVFTKDLPHEALGCVGLLQTVVIVVNRSKFWHEAVKWPEYIFNVLSFLKFSCFKSQKSRVCYTEHDGCYTVDGEQCVVQMERDGQGYVKQIQQDLGKVSSAVLV